MKTLHRLSAIAIAAAVVVASGVHVTGAKATRLASWEYSRVWPSALRFLRVDEGYTLVEKDVEAGYVLFDVEHNDKTYRGSLELVRTKDYAERDAVRLIIKITDRPIYVEDGVLERLLQKLRTELGQPVDPPEPAPKQPPNGDKDGGSGGKKAGDKA